MGMLKNLFKKQTHEQRLASLAQQRDKLGDEFNKEQDILEAESQIAELKKARALQRPQGRGFNISKLGSNLSSSVKNAQGGFNRFRNGMTDTFGNMGGFDYVAPKPGKKQFNNYDAFSMAMPNRKKGKNPPLFNSI